MNYIWECFTWMVTSDELIALCSSLFSYCERGTLVIRDFIRYCSEAPSSVWILCISRSTCLDELVATNWNRNVVILTIFSLLAAPEVVILTTSGAASNENVVKIIAFRFQCTNVNFTPFSFFSLKGIVVNAVCLSVCLSVQSVCLSPHWHWTCPSQTLTHLH